MGIARVPNSIAGPIHAEKYLSRNCTDTLWSNSTALCLAKTAHAARLRLRNSVIIRVVVDEQRSFPRYL